ncbi:MAG: IS110 family transposase [bacterium]
MTQTTYLPKDYELFIGLDVDKKSFSFTIQDHNIMKRTKTIPAQPQYFYNYLQNNYSNKQIICAYEAGPTGYHLYDYLTQKNIPCLVVPPLSIPKAPNERVKTNRIDSVKLTALLKAGSLKSIRVPQDEWRELRHLVKIRQNYASLRKVTQQRIKALLLFAHLDGYIKDPYQKWSCNHINEIKKIPCQPAIRDCLDMLIDDLFYARKQLLTIHRVLRSFCNSHENIKNYLSFLQSIPGIGFVVAVTLLGNIGDPKNLKDPRELASFVGLVPRENSTGDDVNRGSITHLGDKVLRFLLIEAAWVAIRKDIRLYQFYCRIKNRHHSEIAKKKAITAVARKLTAIIYRILKEERKYIPHF